MLYDYIIIGAGSAGSILAARLTEAPSVSVLLLEAGRDFPDLEHLPSEVRYSYGRADKLISESAHNWKFMGKASDRGEPMTVPRGKVTGGSSAINAQIFLRGESDDYDSWAEMGNTEWSYQKVLPFFRKLENDQDFRDDYHGTDGPIYARREPRENWPPAQLAFLDACRSAGFPESPDHNNPDSTGVGPLPRNDLDGTRVSTAIGYLGMSRHRLNLTIRGECHVRRILFDGDRAVGAEVESGGETFSVRGREIILSAGAIGSPHILMLSGVGPRDQLEQHGIPVLRDVPGVGQNLRDHPLIFLAWKTKPGYDLGRANSHGLSLRYTATGSDLRNDMMLIMLTTAVKREERGLVGNKPIGVGMIAHLYLAKSAGELRLAVRRPQCSALPGLQHAEPPLRRPASERRSAAEPEIGRTSRLRRHNRRACTPHRRRVGERRGVGRLDEEHRVHRPPHLLHLQDGAVVRPDGRSGPVRPCPRLARPARSRRIHHARLRARQHQRPHHDDRRARGRLHLVGPVTPPHWPLASGHSKLTPRRPQW